MTRQEIAMKSKFCKIKLYSYHKNIKILIFSLIQVILNKWIISCEICKLDQNSIMKSCLSLAIEYEILDISMWFDLKCFYFWIIIHIVFLRRWVISKHKVSRRIRRESRRLLRMLEIPLLQIRSLVKTLVDLYAHYSKTTAPSHQNIKLLI